MLIFYIETKKSFLYPVLKTLQRIMEIEKSYYYIHCKICGVRYRFGLIKLSCTFLPFLGGRGEACFIILSYSLYDAVYKKQLYVDLLCIESPRKNPIRITRPPILTYKWKSLYEKDKLKFELICAGLRIEVSEVGNGSVQHGKYHFRE